MARGVWTRRRRLSAEKRAAVILRRDLQRVYLYRKRRGAVIAGEESLGKIITDFLQAEKEDVRNVFIRKYYFFDSISLNTFLVFCVELLMDLLINLIF